MRALGFRATKQKGQWHVDVYEDMGHSHVVSIDGPWDEVVKILTDLDREQEQDWEVFEE